MTQGLKQAAQERDRRQFAQDCVSMAATIEQMFTEATRLLIDWENNDFATEITEQDLAVYRFEITDLHNFVGMLNAVKQMANNEPVTQGEYLRINARIK